MDIIFSEEFRRDFRKIRDRTTRLSIIAHLKKLCESPTSGKPLRYSLKEYRGVRVGAFRIIYRIERDAVVVNCFGPRKSVYGR